MERYPNDLIRIMTFQAGILGNPSQEFRKEND